MDELLKSSESKEWPITVENKISGFMKSEDFSKLCDAIKCDPWRDPDRDSGGCDGVAWEITSYQDGVLYKTSGKLGYIYGHQNLETLVSLLPRDRKVYELN
ncbi:MAG: hypothetical protein IJL67_11280 [Oscillospiraceae bacterium]|nr:hypothetical protein [Oscillospiraceae bacterium]